VQLDSPEELHLS